MKVRCVPVLDQGVPVLVQGVPLSARVYHIWYTAGPLVLFLTTLSQHLIRAKMWSLLTTLTQHQNFAQNLSIRRVDKKSDIFLLQASQSPLKK